MLSFFHWPNILGQKRHYIFWTRFCYSAIPTAIPSKLAEIVSEEAYLLSHTSLFSRNIFLNFCSIEQLTRCESA